MSYFQELNVSTKIYIAISICLSGLIFCAGFAMYQINEVGKQLTAIAEEDIPLTVEITEAAATQLEQTIYLERMLRSVMVPAQVINDQAKLENLASIFHEKGMEVETYLARAIEIAEHGREHALDQHMETEFDATLRSVRTIIDNHKEFERHAQDLQALLLAGDTVGGVRLGEKVDLEAEKLDREIKTLLDTVATFTAQSALYAERQEKIALQGLIILTVAIVVIIGPGVVLLVQASLPRPIKKILKDIGRLAAGDIEQPLEIGPRNEIGQIREGLEIFRCKLIDNRQMASEIQQKQEQALARSERVDCLNRDFENAVAQVVSTVSKANEGLDETARKMAHMSSTAQEKSSVILSTTDSSAANIQSVGSASEQMSAAIGEIVNQTQQATEVAKDAIDAAENMRRNTDDMVGMASSISSVLALISGIAEQTNLLALNATIEAARAGSAGKGFAVVAGEVKQLANQTAEATKDISNKISSMQAATSSAAGAIDGILTTIQNVDDVINAISDAVNEQSQAVSDINHHMRSASDGSQQINREMRDIAHSVTNTGQSASDVQKAAGLLRAESETLTAHIERFLADVKAA